MSVVDERTWNHVIVPGELLLHPAIDARCVQTYCLVTWHLESRREQVDLALVASEARCGDEFIHLSLKTLDDAGFLAFLANGHRLALRLPCVVPAGSTLHASGFQRWLTSSSPFLYDDVWEEDEWVEPTLKPDTDKVPGHAKIPIPRSLRTKVFERDGYRCQTPGCGSWKDLQADHIQPESKGGLTTLDNLQTLCRPCNARKGATVR